MEQALIIGIVLVAIFMVMVFTNVPISVALGGSTIVTMLLFGVSIDSYADLMVSGMRKFSYLAIPFFILSGILMDRSGVAARIIRFAKACIGHITGGLAIMSIVVSVFWGAISGAGPATVAALGGVLIPSMDEEGYDKGFAAAVVAAAGGISIIIPPSITFVIYGVLANVSIGDLFIAGVIPGLFMGLCFCIYAYIYCRKHGYHGSAKVQKGEVWKTFKEAFLGILSPVIILGGIYGGIFTPTEAAAISVFYSLILALFVYKTVSLKSLFKIFVDSGISSAVIMIIIGNATVFSWFCTAKGIAPAVSRSLEHASSSHVVVLFIMLVILLIAGCLINGNSIFYIFVPIFLPIIKNMGLDPLWFGVFMSMAAAVGMITPPVAVNLYPAANCAKIFLARISMSILPLVAVAVLATIVVMLVPELSTWLPSLMVK